MIAMRMTRTIQEKISMKDMGVNPGSAAADSVNAARADLVLWGGRALTGSFLKSTRENPEAARSSGAA
jgi:hypothetical protein